MTPKIWTRRTHVGAGQAKKYRSQPWLRSVCPRVVFPQLCTFLSLQLSAGNCLIALFVTDYCYKNFNRPRRRSRWRGRGRLELELGHLGGNRLHGSNRKCLLGPFNLCFNLILGYT